MPNEEIAKQLQLQQMKATEAVRQQSHGTSREMHMAAEAAKVRHASKAIDARISKRLEDIGQELKEARPDASEATLAAADRLNEEARRATKEVTQGQAELERRLAEATRGKSDLVREAAAPFTERGLERVKEEAQKLDELTHKAADEISRQVYEDAPDEEIRNTLGHASQEIDVLRRQFEKDMVSAAEKIEEVMRGLDRSAQPDNQERRRAELDMDGNQFRSVGQGLQVLELSANIDEQLAVNEKRGPDGQEIGEEEQMRRAKDILDRNIRDAITNSATKSNFREQTHSRVRQEERLVSLAEVRSHDLPPDVPLEPDALLRDNWANIIEMRKIAAAVEERTRERIKGKSATKTKEILNRELGELFKNPDAMKEKYEDHPGVYEAAKEVSKALERMIGRRAEDVFRFRKLEQEQD